MAAYVIVDVEVRDPDGYKAYTSQVLATVEAHGGRFIVRGVDHETRQGTGQPKPIVILEFPGIESARAWYDSPEYQAILPVRKANSHCDFLTAVGGHDG